MQSNRTWQYRIAAALLPVSLGLYVGSLAMHVAQVERKFQVFGVGKADVHAFRLLNTIEDLWKDGDFGLAIIIVAFTLLFPISKYLALGYVMLTRNVRARDRVLSWVKNLGQWSMGDVFVVAMLVVVVRVNNNVANIHVEPLLGLWVFTSSVITSMIASVLLGFHFNGKLARDPR